MQQNLNKVQFENHDNYDDVRTSHRAHQCESWLAPTSSSYLKTGWQQILSKLILSQTYPTRVYLAHYLDMQSFLALEFIFAGKRLMVDPYFQYFSSSLMYKYQLGLHNIQSKHGTSHYIFQEYHKHIFHPRLSILIPLLLRCDAVTKLLLTERDDESIRFNLARRT